MDTAKIARLVRYDGEQNGQVYKITVGRDDLNLTEMEEFTRSTLVWGWTRGQHSWRRFRRGDSRRLRYVGV